MIAETNQFPVFDEMLWAI